MNKKIFAAARKMDWQQVVMNGGPPCFHRTNERFCGRAERWPGHDQIAGTSYPFHAFVSLEDLLRTALKSGANT